MLLIARTDAESGKLLSSNVDITDHEFILGTTTKGSVALAEALAAAETKGATGAEVDRIEQEWTQKHQMCTFNQGQLIVSTGICMFLGLIFFRSKLLRELSRRRAVLKTRLVHMRLTLLLSTENPTVMLEK